MIIRAVPEYWRAKWSSLKRIASLPLLPEMDGDIALLAQLAGEVWDRAADVDVDGVVSLLNSLVEVRDDYDVHATDLLFVPKFREDFHAWWEAA